jgi:hypothetical protein
MDFLSCDAKNDQYAGLIHMASVGFGVNLNMTRPEEGRKGWARCCHDPQFPNTTSALLRSKSSCGHREAVRLVEIQYFLGFFMLLIENTFQNYKLNGISRTFERIR